jgi:nicotinamidase-related amidase
MIMPVVRVRPNRVIVDIDTQRHFFAKNSFICVKDHRRVLANILRVINWAQHSSIRRISTVQVIDHDHCPCPSCLAARLGQGKVGFTVRGRHTSFDATDCTDLMPGIFEQYEQLIFQKRCFDPFEEPRVDRTLTELKPDEFILIGAATEGAVRATASGLLARGKNVTILADATGAYDGNMGGLVLRVLSERGAKVVDTQTFLDTQRLQSTQIFRLDWQYQSA